MIAFFLRGNSGEDLERKGTLERGALHFPWYADFFKPPVSPFGPLRVLLSDPIWFLELIHHPSGQRENVSLVASLFECPVQMLRSTPSRANVGEVINAIPDP